jgi:hypothetical protein
MKKKLIASIAALSLALASAGAFTPHAQVAAVGGANTVTSAGAGVFPAGASFQAVELAGGTFGIGVQTDGLGAAKGDLELQLNGTSLIGLAQWITVTGWITGATQNADGSMAFSGTGTLDMGDGSAPVGGLPLTATLTATSLSVTIGGNAIPSLPKSDGSIFVE